MIVFDLICDGSHRFEGWFASTSQYEDQLERGLVTCPECDSAAVRKAPMAPAIPAKGNRQDPAPRDPASSGSETVMSNRAIPPAVEKAMRALAAAQAKALSQSKWVGTSFAEESRAMHYGEKDLATIHGKATLQEAKELLDEGISVAPLPFPVAEPDELN
ncbi:DUF1178 family protein [Erythrobacter sp. LQ02-29]|uniref:DUF1178 family protein n=1 Tax=Erythrobacter sp. LQ02-29 TaxID=2920384 RepID=UPI001F4D74A6|nr:DUF1178 family protein [Erythrobacter sp. LQ02-29]MCP9223293.1 DUF1178 family protein [Erythrobacter sp. LQ02-29]